MLYPEPMWMQVQEVAGTDWSTLLIAVLSGAVGGAVVSGVFSVLKSRLEAKTEHAKWLREKRYEAYFTVLQSLDDIFQETPEENRARLATVRRALTELRMIAPEALKLTLGRVWDAELKQFVPKGANDTADASARERAIEEFRQAIRKALKLI